MLTTIKNKVVIESDKPLWGKYLVDKECPQADVCKVIRKLKDDESPWAAWEAQRSDNAWVVHVTGNTGHILV